LALHENQKVSEITSKTASMTYCAY